MLTNFLIGLGFFCLVNSITYLPLQNLLAVVGVYTLAHFLGFVAFFAPAGLGIREGTLVLFLQFYFPLNAAILISLLTRVWTVAGDLLMVVSALLLNLKEAKNIFKDPRIYKI